MLAVISAVFDASEIAAAAQAIAALYDPTPRTSDARTQPRAL
jgi:hypothetical protein